MWPATKRNFTQEQFRKYVDVLMWPKWRPSKIVWHNTAAPSLHQWIVSAAADRKKGLIPGESRINSLERFFRHDNGWSGCPHLFIANDYIWEMNSLTAPGVHSPSFNHTAIGIEMIGDFSHEDDDAGEGLKVKNNTIFATALLCAELGLEPKPDVILLHKEDRRTTHDCPGKDIALDKLAMIEDVANLMTGGEHDPAGVAAVISGTTPDWPLERQGITTAKDLNFRRGPGVNNEATGSLPINLRVTVLDTARNGETSWLRVRTPNGHVGWVAGQFVKELT